MTLSLWFSFHFHQSFVIGLFRWLLHFYGQLYSTPLDFDEVHQSSALSSPCMHQLGIYSIHYLQRVAILVSFIFTSHYDFSMCFIIHWCHLLHNETTVLDHSIWNEPCAICSPVITYCMIYFLNLDTELNALLKF